MNFNDTLKSVELVIETNEVPLIVGESGIGKTALAKALARKHEWSLVVIDGNLLKEGEIGGLPTVEEYSIKDSDGRLINKKATIYAIHTKLREIDNLILEGKDVLLFIDEINRCEHSVQQELMNLILNREINGYKLHDKVKILAAMNPSSKYGSDFDYQVVDMDAAQENRFVWLNMESDAKGWIKWASENQVDIKIIEFISTFPEHLHSINEEDIRATPRSFERVSKSYKLYKENKDNIPRRVFLNVLRGNLGRTIAEQLMDFIESDNTALISPEEVFEERFLSENVKIKISKESHTRLYLIGSNMINYINSKVEELEGAAIKKVIDRFVEFLSFYPVDLMIGIMQDMRESKKKIYNFILENEDFVENYFAAYTDIKG
ncbi:ATP-binding protein [uncultured Clostridium sp.]|uniref:ATP-binding protein n=1 Tax=uncultured Clostridium sp. TaxID=59620 RepID=UPI0032164006